MEKRIIGNATLYLGDCMAVLPTLDRVDAVITDPPYGVLDEEWDDMSRRELARFTMGWASQAARLSPLMMTFFGEKTRATVSPLLEMLYPLVRQLIWNKQGGNIAENRFFYAYESVFLCHSGETWEVAEPKSLMVASLLKLAREAAGMSKGAVDMVVRGKKTGLCYRWEEAACLPSPDQVDVLRQHLSLGADFDAVLMQAYAAKEKAVSAAREKAAEQAARATDVLTFSPPASKQHPCEKPVPLFERLIESVPSAQTILDPFMGSGMTGVAAVKMGRKFIGIERDPAYFEICCKRIDDAQKQPDMFSSPASKVATGNLFAPA